MLGDPADWKKKRVVLGLAHGQNLDEGTQVSSES